MIRRKTKLYKYAEINTFFISNTDIKKVFFICPNRLKAKENRLEIKVKFRKLSLDNIYIYIYNVCGNLGAKS